MATIKPLLLSTALIVSLAACTSTPFRELNSGDPVKSTTDKEQILNSARQASLGKKYEQVRNGDLSSAEDAYRNSPSDPYAALSYAKLLRSVDMYEQADLVLKPFADNPAQASEAVLLEYAKLKLITGDFDSAQMLAQEANFMTDSPESLMLLGVALDTQGHHEAAETHFRQALANVGMDIKMKNKIMNNLAISLLSQGRRNESVVVLSQIQDAASSDNGVVQANRQLAENL